MIKAIFNLIRSMFTLTEVVVTNVANKFEESKPTITSKLEEAAQNIRKKSGIDKNN